MEGPAGPARFRAKAAPWATAVLLGVLLLLPAVARAAEPADAPVAYTLPLSAVNITDHNLTYGSNMIALHPIAAASFSVSLRSTLVAATGVPLDRAEAEIGLGPVPAGDEETNITPLFIVQEAASGLLRIEYVPFPMNDTYGFVVYWGNPVTPAPDAFAGHTLTLSYVETAPPVLPYPVTVYYGHATGNVTVSWDGTVLVPPYPVAWASFGAFYAYGLMTGAFADGSVYANVTTSAAQSAPGPSLLVGPGAMLGVVPVWAVAGAVGAIVGGVVGATVARTRLRAG